MERALSIRRWPDLPGRSFVRSEFLVEKGHHDGEGGVHIRGGRGTHGTQKRREESGSSIVVAGSAGVGKMANLANKLSRKLVGNKLEAGFVARVYSSGES